jgi:hypothetical protein
MLGDIWTQPELTMAVDTTWNNKKEMALSAGTTCRYTTWRRSKLVRIDPTETHQPPLHGTYATVVNAHKSYATHNNTSMGYTYSKEP